MGRSKIGRAGYIEWRSCCNLRESVEVAVALVDEAGDTEGVGVVHFVGGS